MDSTNEISVGARYSGVEDIQAVLDGVRNRCWLVGVFRTLFLAVGISAAGLFLVSLCGYWSDQPPATLRWGGLAGVLVLWAAALGLVVRSLFRRFNLAQAARFVESRRPELRNDLINTVQLARDADQPSPALVQSAIYETVGRVGHVDLRRSVSLRPLGGAAGIALAAGIVLATFIALQPGVFRRGALAVLRPGAYVPANNTLPLVSLAPGDAEVFPSDPVTIRLAVRSSPDEDTQAHVVFDGDDTPGRMYLVESSPSETDATVFEYRVEAVHEPLRYFVRAENRNQKGRWPARKQWYRVGLRSLHLDQFDVRYEYPEYTRLSERNVTLSPAGGDLEAPTGSLATVSVRLNQPVARGVSEFKTNRRVDMDRRDGGKTFATRFTVRGDGGYRILFFGEDERELLRLPDGRGEEFFQILAIPDAPPKVSIASPTREADAPAGGTLPVRINASDDYGFTELQLQAGREGQPLKSVPAFQVKLDGKKKLSVTFPWSLKEFAVGDVVVYQAVATDNRKLGALEGPRTTKTPLYRVRVQPPAKIQADRTRRLQEFQQRLLAFLELQTKLRVRTSLLSSSDRTQIETSRNGQAVYDGQKRIHGDLSSLSNTFPFAPTMDDLRKALVFLTNREANLAVEQSEALRTVTDKKQLPALCNPLLRTQDAIIAALREMLAIAPILAKQFQDIEQKSGEDLPADSRREKREELNAALQKFTADQKKIIEASRRLNKKALDDFTPADRKLLDDLIASQDQWEKFLNEAFTDFSKFAEQDFANPSLLKELLSVKADVTMARDALQAKAVEIATACEENGLENAESLTANLEKWLPDTPDRIRWDMEAPEAQDNIEQAELPTELEDLMAELLEEEEDLFEEMDDISSKATMSGDKGIGWDAVDGPISNMNAQGVTGNRLPNTSEIQGRSGEGRSGKSSGEYVEDKAVGKGGRRTPTRLSDDPFQKGQIKDASTDPGGGATGGGKVSGAGAEGLEGPTPAPTAEQLKRLAGRQASIVNRAERVAARLKIGDYAGFRMNQAVLLMNRVRRDLEAGDYQNALRRRESTLGAIRRTREMLTGELDIQRDTSKSIPKEQLDEITNAMQSPQPKEYREALRHYYQRLSEISTK
ncbi:MAG: hypothetical protein JXA11_11160 [Phycisphaerae bacterium]|nr:hypothetical protein [Phycisphaerae bacterium]